jgi:DNA-binding XRE family transcriptional regulator
MCQLEQMENTHALTVWRKEQKLSQGEFAEKLGVTRWMVNSIETGRRIPSMNLAIKVQQVTSGAVTPNDFSRSSEVAQ